MVIKVYVAMISCSQEVKKNQQRAVMILESKKIPYSIIDITDPANEDSKDYMVETATPKEGSKIPVTPQLYNEADYCGDYDGLDMANECDTLGDFLKLSEEEKKAIKIGITGIIPTNKTEENESHITNGVSASREDTTNPEDAVDGAEVEAGEALIDGPSEQPVVEDSPTAEDVEEKREEEETKEEEVKEETKEEEVKEETKEEEVKEETKEEEVKEETKEEEVKEETKEEEVKEETKEEEVTEETKEEGMKEANDDDEREEEEA